MDRLFKVYCKRGYTLAEVEFSYDKRQQVTVKYKQYSMLYESQDPDTGEITISTYERSSEHDPYHTFREFSTIEDVKAHDIEYAKKRFGRDMNEPAGYEYIYETEPVLRRYVISNHSGCIGIADIKYNFPDNIKEIRFLSGKQFIDDMVMTESCLKTNYNLIQSLPMTDRWGEPWHYDAESTRKVDSWINRD